MCEYYIKVKARVLIDRQMVIRRGKYAVDMKVFEVQKSKKFPGGIKAKFLLKDIELGFARLLVDNHEPFGFHMHTKLPEEKDHRMELDVIDYNEAMALFFEEVERIANDEEK